MVDYMIFDVVRASMNDALACGEKIGFGDGAIAVEVKNLPKADSVTKIHEFLFSEVMTTNNFNDQKTEFLREHTHAAHERHLRGESIAPTGWGTGQITIGYKTLFFPEEPSDYSIVIAVMGDHTETNQKLLDAVIRSLPDRPR